MEVLSNARKASDSVGCLRAIVQKIKHVPCSIIYPGQPHREPNWAERKGKLSALLMFGKNVSPLFCILFRENLFCILFKESEQ